MKGTFLEQCNRRKLPVILAGGAVLLALVAAILVFMGIGRKPLFLLWKHLRNSLLSCEIPLPWM